ncbi:hypothetical protein [Methylicorpusculum sp.]|uniref:hypothetical protein n=1 Tax=Methylicorpusculum sp. TaxID=2713644 RepID=UPI00272FD736|nr:hypothetical protein [Methylicorpusculum sp.]MDP2178764.1 hypothetical protein [Methylicorpusculum sp.]MDP3527756.1 hypothetical protein [Methylicorpusculum sp.]MDZ4153640.1 hypothetical protein [Methylicorpusculum sp.]
MAILYQAKGSQSNTVVPDARWSDTNNVGTVDKSGRHSSTFFNKHIRIVKTLPSKDEMNQIVDDIWGDRNKSPATIVTSPLGEQRRKDALYGGIKPPANTVLFVTAGGFESLNAYIEEWVNDSGENWVPIPPGGVVVGRWIDKSSKVVDLTKSYIFESGYWELGVDVGPAVGGMTMKVVYHFGDAKRSMMSIIHAH